MAVGKHPFGPEDHGLRQRALDGVVTFPGSGEGGKIVEGDWNRHLIDCIKGMLHVDPNKRLSAEELLRHPWLTGKSAETDEPCRQLARSETVTNRAALLQRARTMHSMKVGAQPPAS